MIHLDLPEHVYVFLGQTILSFHPGHPRLNFVADYDSSSSELQQKSYFRDPHHKAMLLLHKIH